MLDIFQGVASFATGLIRTHRLDKWAKLVFELCFSYSTSFSIVCGGALVSGQGTLISIGSGMISGAVMATIVFRRSELTKGMLVVLPMAEAVAEIEADHITIERPK
jgi:hypothetical protein